MKKSILFIAIFAITLMSSTQIAGQAFKDLDKSPMDAAAYPSSYKESDKIVKPSSIKRKRGSKTSSSWKSMENRSK